MSKKERERKISKIIFCGLDNSGKTSFIARLKNQEFPTSPTTSVERSQYDIFGFPILIWDFGGQQKLRDSYLKKTDLFFHGTDLLFYLIDIQDDARFDESLSYFEKLLEVFEEKPIIFVIFHKADPDIAESQKVNQNIEKIKERLNKPLKKFQNFYASATIFDYSTLIAPFSLALSKILPFAAVLNSYIINFVEQQHLSCVILMDNNGAIVSKISRETVDLEFCEITGTYLVQLFESYMKKSKLTPEISLQLSGGTPENPAGIILFDQIQIYKMRYYLTILTKDEKRIESIKDAISEFILGLSKTIEISY